MRDGAYKILNVRVILILSLILLQHESAINGKMKNNRLPLTLLLFSLRLLRYDIYIIEND